MPQAVKYHICKICGASILETGESQPQHLKDRHGIESKNKPRFHFRAPFEEQGLKY